MVNDREAWSAAVHGVAKSRTWLSTEQQLNDMLLLTQRLIKKYSIDLQLIKYIDTIFLQFLIGGKLLYNVYMLC